MKPKMKEILSNVHKYNVGNMAQLNFGLDPNVTYDALVVAPGWKPTNIIQDNSFKITTLATHSYISGYLVEKDNLKIGWMQIASGASNLLDHLVLAAELSFNKLIFVGAVGALTNRFNVGDICTPSYCIAGVFANAYLLENMYEYKPFNIVKPNETYIQSVIELAHEYNFNLQLGSVFCTDSIALEYYHLDEIKKYNTDLIEMETSTFYLVAELLEVPAIALLVVSDNSASGHPLVGRNDELQNKYNHGRKDIIPELIYRITNFL
jgi:purine-nucleoside phosphorylase